MRALWVGLVLVTLWVVDNVKFNWLDSCNRYYTSAEIAIDSEQRHSPLGVRIARRELGEPVPFGRAILFFGVFFGCGGWLLYRLIGWLIRYPSNRDNRK